MVMALPFGGTSLCSARMERFGILATVSNYLMYSTREEVDRLVGKKSDWDVL